MIRNAIRLLLFWLIMGTASAQTCGSLPYSLTNGTTADAAQVMGNFNHVVACNNGLAAFFRGWLGGLTMSNNAGSPNTVIDTSAGVANADDATTLMSLAAFTKNANAAWAVGSGNGCLDSGSSLAASTWYHLTPISREIEAALRITDLRPTDTLILIPKPKQAQVAVGVTTGVGMTSANASEKGLLGTGITFRDVANFIVDLVTPGGAGVVGAGSDIVPGRSTRAASGLRPKK